ncbi:MAG: hypothetical protein A2Z34_03600 [Planctomycetes bacterium RBG_16_59_8]|nr:MAG: hypothetical protein A2Z34_03600 [Planctomycetes bacterium RBG_16_59_8]
MNRKWRESAWRPEYHRAISSVLGRIIATQRRPILAAAKVIADVIEKNGILYLLGSGHSLAVAMEAHGRAGGMVPVEIVFDRSFGKLERLSGYAKILFEQYDIPRNSALIVISNSGRNALPVEMALEAKARGIPVIALTSLAHSRSVSSRQGGGKRLFEIADIVIDNCGVPGDAIVRLRGVPERVGPTSAVAGTFIMNLVMVETIRRLRKAGVPPPILISANLDGSDDHNRKLRRRYRGRIRGL